MTHQQAVDSMASERYLLDEMSEVERFEFEAHYFGCTECADDVRLANVMREEAQRGAGVVSGFSRTETPAKVLPFWKRATVVVPWAAAAALALMVGYQSRELRRSVAPESLTPIMLRGATRGAVPVVTVADGQRFVTLTVDLLSPSPTRALRYELVRAGQSPVVSGEAPRPPDSTSFMLLVPAAELDRGARYSLIIRSADSANAVIGKYDFDVS